MYQHKLLEYKSSHSSTISSIKTTLNVNSHETSEHAESILSHYEHWDGKGYPQGLDCENMPLISRVFSVADSYDAMAQDRPYRKARTHEEAIMGINRCAGSKFDPQISQIFIESFNRKSLKSILYQ